MEEYVPKPIQRVKFPEYRPTPINTTLKKELLEDKSAGPRPITIEEYKARNNIKTYDQKINKKKKAQRRKISEDQKRVGISKKKNR